jgi:hypothetical protein
MKMRKGADTENILSYVGVILIMLMIVYIATRWFSTGGIIGRTIEEASLIYTITTAANALSTVERGLVEKQLLGNYDIIIGTKERDDVNTNSYIQVTYHFEEKGKQKTKTAEYFVLGAIEPTELTEVNCVKIVKDYLSGPVRVQKCEDYEMTSYDVDYTGISPQIRARIEELHPKIRDKVAEFFRQVKSELGISLEFLPQGTYRDPGTQQEIYESETGATQAKGWESYHQYGLAIDIDPVTQDVARIGKSLGFEWGGDWEFYDPVHFQMIVIDDVRYGHAELREKIFNGDYFVENGRKYPQIA